MNTFAFPLPSNRKKVLIRIARILVLLLVSLFSGAVKADSLWVHHIGVGQGDATLIIAWQRINGRTDTTTFLIDAGNSSGKGQAVFDYINAELSSIKHLNYIITSHLHSDHIGGMPKVLEQLHANNWRVDYILDRGATDVPLPDSCYSALDYSDNDPVEPVDLPGSAIYKSYEDAVANWFNGKRFNLPTGIDLFAQLGRKNNMQMIAAGSNGCTLVEFGKTTLSCPHIASPDENDFSFVFLMMFEGFKYFTGGDIGGEAPYYNFEAPLISYFKTYPIMDFHFCVYKASHHGSPNSSNAAFVTYTTPTLTVIPSALRSFNGTQLPGQATINRLTTANSKFAYTYNYTNTPYSGGVANYIDVKFSVTNPSYYENITIPVYTRNRAKTSPYAPTSVFALQQTITCGQYHDQIESSAVTKLSPELSPAPVMAIQPATSGIRSSDLSPAKVRKIKRLDKKAFRARTKSKQLREMCKP